MRCGTAQRGGARGASPHRCGLPQRVHPLEGPGQSAVAVDDRIEELLPLATAHDAIVAEDLGCRLDHGDTGPPFVFNRVMVAGLTFAHRWAHPCQATSVGVQRIVAAGEMVTSDGPDNRNRKASIAALDASAGLG